MPLRSVMSFILTLAAFSGAAWFGYRAVTEWRRGSAIDQDIATLERTNRDTAGENLSLEERIDYLKTDNFREQEGKRKFNYQKAGEQVVVIQPAPAASAASLPTTEEEPAAVSFPEPTYRKWWDRFFASSPQP